MKLVMLTTAMLALMTLLAPTSMADDAEAEQQADLCSYNDTGSYTYKTCIVEDHKDRGMCINSSSRTDDDTGEVSDEDATLCYDSLPNVGNS